jgi:hypothetical protein
MISPVKGYISWTEWKVLIGDALEMGYLESFCGKT